MKKHSLVRRSNPIHLILLKEEASNFLLWDFKGEILQLAHAKEV